MPVSRGLLSRRSIISSAFVATVLSRLRQTPGLAAVGNPLYMFHKREAFAPLLNGGSSSERLQPFLFINDYPKDRNNGWHHNLQGVTHDDGYWFITQRDRLWKIPVDYNLNADIADGGSRIRSVSLSDLPLEGYDHFGDFDHHEGFLYVPVESVGRASVPIVAILYASDLGFFDWGRLSRQGADNQSPWCAVSPQDGLLYSSSFSIDSGQPVRTYERTPWRGEFEPVGVFHPRDEQGELLEMERVQGGAFSQHGNLYLVSDTGDGGILGFDGDSGKRMAHTVIDYSPEGDTSGVFDVANAEELEGITIWDLDSGAAPGIQGQVHVLMIDLDVNSDDDLYFKHFRVRSSDMARL